MVCGVKVVVEEAHDVVEELRNVVEGARDVEVGGGNGVEGARDVEVEGGNVVVGAHDVEVGVGNVVAGAHSVAVSGDVVEEARNVVGVVVEGNMAQEVVCKVHDEIEVVESMGLAQSDAQEENEVQAGNDHWLLIHQPGHHGIARQDKQNKSLSKVAACRSYVRNAQDVNDLHHLLT